MSYFTKCGPEYNTFKTIWKWKTWMKLSHSSFNCKTSLNFQNLMYHSFIMYWCFCFMSSIFPFLVTLCILCDVNTKMSYFFFFWVALNKLNVFKLNLFHFALFVRKSKHCIWYPIKGTNNDTYCIHPTIAWELRNLEKSLLIYPHDCFNIELHF